MKHRFNIAPANIRKKRVLLLKFQKTIEPKKDGVSSIDLHLLENVVVMKVVFPVNFVRVKQ